MASQFIATYQDVLDRLNLFLRNRPVAQSVDQSTIRSCAETALREIVSARDWTCLKRIYRVPLQATVSTGTIQYQASGGTYPYQVTLTGSTWPSWAGDAELRIGAGSVICEVDKRISNTVITLKSPRVPSVDYAAGTAYSLGLSWYRLPADFIATWSPAEKNAWFIGEYVPFEEMMLLTKYRTMVGIVKRYSIGPCPKDPNLRALYVYPWSSNTEEEDLLVKVRPRTLALSGHDASNYAGTVSISSGSTTLTGVSTAFKSAMVGSIIRLGDTTNKPTGTSGPYPFAWQEQIATVASTTSATVSYAPSESFSAVKYVIADPVEFDAAVYDAFLRNCEKQLAYVAGMKDYDKIERAYFMALQEAKKQDAPVKQRQVAGQGTGFMTRLRDFKTRPWIGG